MMINESLKEFNKEEKEKSEKRLDYSILKSIPDKNILSDFVILDQNDASIANYYKEKVKRKNKHYEDYSEIESYDNEGNKMEGCIYYGINKNLHLLFVFGTEYLSREKKFADFIHRAMCKNMMYGDCAYFTEYLSLKPWEEYEHKLSLQIARTIIDRYGYYSIENLKGLIEFLFRQQEGFTW